MPKKKRKNNNYQTDTLAQKRDEFGMKTAKLLETARKNGSRLDIYETKAYLKSRFDFSNNQIDRLIETMTRNPGLNFQTMSVITSSLTNLYNAQIVKQQQGLSEKELLQLDMIDLSSLSTEELDVIVKENAREQFKNDQQNKFYYMLPCFESGIILHDPKRIILYSVSNIDEEKQSYHLHIQDYSKVNPQHEYQSGITGTCDVRLMQPETKNGIYEQRAAIENLQFVDFPQLYRRFRPKDLGWDELSEKIWKQFVVTNSDNIAEKQKAIGVNPAERLISMFLAQIMAANYLLTKHRAKANTPKPDESQVQPIEDKPKSNPETTTQANHNAKQPERPERIVYHIGRMKVTAKKKPVRMTKRTIRQYHVTEWKRRGHVRHLKSGKTVYIRESVFKRRNLQQTEELTATIPKTIKLYHEDETTNV